MFSRDIFGYSFGLPAKRTRFADRPIQRPLKRPVRRDSTPRDGRGALCYVPAFSHCGFRLMLQKDSESDPA